MDVGCLGSRLVVGVLFRFFFVSSSISGTCQVGHNDSHNRCFYFEILESSKFWSRMPDVTNITFKKSPLSSPIGIFSCHSYRGWFFSSSFQGSSVFLIHFMRNIKQQGHIHGCLQRSHQDHACKMHRSTLFCELG